MSETLDEHYSYLSDRTKLKQYGAAIKKCVTAEHVVLDLGCGSGLLGLMALRAGARKVFFVEEGPIIEVARRTIEKAGFAAQADFFQKNSFELELPEPVDVVICDHVGYFGFDYGILSLLADAKQRFLKPDGAVLPDQIALMLAPVESSTCRTFAGRWTDGSVPDDYSWVASTVSNTKHSAHLGSRHLLAGAGCLASLDLGTCIAPFLSWTAEFCSTRNGTLDGIASWFDCRLVDDICMTNSPLAHERLDRPQAFLPLPTPLRVKAGEHIKTTVMVRHLDSIIGWVVTLAESGKRVSQTTFNGLLLDSKALTLARPDRVAKLNKRGLARQLVLSYCDGTRSIAEVQALVQRDHRTLFPSEQATSSFVGAVLQRDTSE